MIGGSLSRLALESFTSRGLLFLKTMTTSPSIRRRAKTIAEHLDDGKVHTDNIGIALLRTPYDEIHPIERHLAYMSRKKISFDGDQARKCNAAWLWANDYKTEIYYYKPKDKSLRRWAYVMWDIERLQKWKVLDMTAEEMRKKTYELGADVVIQSCKASLVD
jgi:hypothetical protein